jgi:hypothetical protein
MSFEEEDVHIDRYTCIDLEIGGYRGMFIYQDLLQMGPVRNPVL